MTLEAQAPLVVAHVRRKSASEATTTALRPVRSPLEDKSAECIKTWRRAAERELDLSNGTLDPVEVAVHTARARLFRQCASDLAHALASVAALAPSSH